MEIIEYCRKCTNASTFCNLYFRTKFYGISWTESFLWIINGIRIWKRIQVHLRVYVCESSSLVFLPWPQHKIWLKYARNLKHFRFEFVHFSISKERTMIKPPFVHPIVYDGVDAAVSHCQPIEGQVHVWGVPGSNPGISCEHNLDEFPVISFEPSWYMILTKTFHGNETFSGK